MKHPELTHKPFINEEEVKREYYKCLKNNDFDGAQRCLRGLILHGCKRPYNPLKCTLN